MGKPGKLEHFNTEPISVDVFKELMINNIEAFTKNMKHHNMGKLTEFEWFYMFGFWNEALEFRDEFPQYFEEWELLKEFK